MTILYGKCNERQQFEVRFAVHKSIALTMKELKVIDHKVSVLIVKAKFFYIVFLNIHAPTKEELQEENEEFYEKVEDILSRMNNSRIRIMWSNETINDNGIKLIELTTGKGLTIMSTIFPIRMYTKVHGRHQIDNMLIKFTTL